MQMERSAIKALAKENVRRQWGDLLLALVLVSVVGTIIAVLSVGTGGIVIAGPLEFGVIYLYYRSLMGEKVDQKMLLAGFKEKFGESFLGGVFATAISMIPVAMLIGSFFTTVISAFTIRTMYYYGGYGYGGSSGSGFAVFSFILNLALFVLFIILFYGFRLGMYILFREKETTAVQAFKKSWAMTKGQRGRLFVFDLSFIGWYLLAGLTLGVLLIWVSPYYTSAKILLFGDIYDHSPVVGVPDFDLKSEVKEFKDKVEDIVDDVVHHEEAPGASAGAVAAAPSEPTYAASSEASYAAPSEPAYTAPAADIPAEEVRYCSHCGAPISATAKFCGKCGAPQELD